MTKYVHERWGDQKVFYVERSFYGHQVKEYCNGAKRTTLKLASNELANFEKKLQENGWKVDYAQ